MVKVSKKEREEGRKKRGLSCVYLWPLLGKVADASRGYTSTSTLDKHGMVRKVLRRANCEQAPLLLEYVLRTMYLHDRPSSYHS